MESKHPNELRFEDALALVHTAMSIRSDGDSVAALEVFRSWVRERCGITNGYFANTPEEAQQPSKARIEAEATPDYSWIKVKRWVDDPSKSWEERFRALEAHHTQETKFLIESGKRRNEEVEDSEDNNPSNALFRAGYLRGMARRFEEGLALTSYDRHMLLRSARSLEKYGQLQEPQGPSFEIGDRVWETNDEGGKLWATVVKVRSINQFVPRYDNEVFGTFQETRFWNNDRIGFDPNKAWDKELAKSSVDPVAPQKTIPHWALVAYVWDRREQYKTSSGTYAAFDELIGSFVDDEHVKSWEHGDLDDLRKHIESLLAKEKAHMSNERLTCDVCEGDGYINILRRDRKEPMSLVCPAFDCNCGSAPHPSNYVIPRSDLVAWLNEKADARLAGASVTFRDCALDVERGDAFPVNQRASKASIEEAKALSIGGVETGVAQLDSEPEGGGAAKPGVTSSSRQSSVGGDGLSAGAVSAEHRDLSPVDAGSSPASRFDPTSACSSEARPDPCEHGFYSNEDAHECWRRPNEPLPKKWTTDFKVEGPMHQACIERIGELSRALSRAIDQIGLGNDTRVVEELDAIQCRRWGMDLPRTDNALVGTKIRIDNGETCEVIAEEVWLVVKAPSGGLRRVIKEGQTQCGSAVEYESRPGFIRPESLQAMFSPERDNPMVRHWRDGWNSALRHVLAAVRNLEAPRNGPQLGEVREEITKLMSAGYFETALVSEATIEQCLDRFDSHTSGRCGHARSEACLETLREWLPRLRTAIARTISIAAATEEEWQAASVVLIHARALTAGTCWTAGTFAMNDYRKGILEALERFDRARLQRGAPSSGKSLPDFVKFSLRDSDLLKAVALAAEKGEGPLTLILQLLGIPPCTSCGFIKSGCRCAK